MNLATRIRLSFSETFRTILSPLTLFIWGASVIGGTIAGPFGTYAIMAWPERAIYWIVVVSISVVLGYGIRALSLALVGAHRPVLLDTIMVVLMTIVFTPVLYLVTQTVRSAQLSELQPLWAFAIYVSLVTVIIITGRRIVPGFETQGYGFLPAPEVAQPVYGTVPQGPRLLRRLPDEARGKVLRLSARDHFVQVVTTRAAQTLRMRLIDAISEMEPVHGYCVHRSHWVAHEAVARVEREQSYKLFVILENGDRIPVSRKYRENLEQAGLI